MQYYLAELDAFALSIEVETEFVDRPHGCCANAQGNKLVQYRRPEALLLEVRQEPVLGLDVRVGDPVPDLDALVRKLTTSTHRRLQPCCLRVHHGHVVHGRRGHVVVRDRHGHVVRGHRVRRRSEIRRHRRRTGRRRRKKEPRP